MASGLVIGCGEKEREREEKEEKEREEEKNLEIDFIIMKGLTKVWLGLGMASLG